MRCSKKLSELVIRVGRIRVRGVVAQSVSIGLKIQTIIPSYSVSTDNAIFIPTFDFFLSFSKPRNVTSFRHTNGKTSTRRGEAGEEREGRRGAGRKGVAKEGRDG